MGRLLVCLFLVACGNKAAPSHPTDSSEKKQTVTTQASPVDAGSTTAPAAKVGVALQVTPDEADVTIDDLVVGKASQLDPVFALAPGLHTLVITHPGYKTYRMEFSVTDKTESFTIHLDPKK